MKTATAPQGDVSVTNVLRLLEAQQYRCALTGRSLTPQTAALDHIVPVRFGGEHVIENAQVLHKDVNRAKGSLTNEEFIGMCREVVRWSDRQITRKESQ
ncbi:MAG: HNH endonuclease [Phycisphaerae bacterium]|nr:HNH endonuclease [Phycisphaerae bacterium]